MQINIRLDSEARDLLNAFPERINLAASRTVNRALAGINTDSAKIIRQRYNVKKRDISIGVRNFKATRSRLEGRIEFGGKPIALDKFNPSPKRYTKNVAALEKLLNELKENDSAKAFIEDYRLSILELSDIWEVADFARNR